MQLVPLSTKKTKIAIVSLMIGREDRFWNFALPFLLYRARDCRWILQGILESGKPLSAFLELEAMAAVIRRAYRSGIFVITGLLPILIVAHEFLLTFLPPPNVERPLESTMGNLTSRPSSRARSVLANRDGIYHHRQHAFSLAADPTGRRR